MGGTFRRYDRAIKSQSFTSKNGERLTTKSATQKSNNQETKYCDMRNFAFNRKKYGSGTYFQNWPKMQMYQHFTLQNSIWVTWPYIHLLPFFLAPKLKSIKVLKHFVNESQRILGTWAKNLVHVVIYDCNSPQLCLIYPISSPAYFDRHKECKSAT